MAMYGIDISDNQRGFNVAGAGAEFAIFKATDGTRFVDESCDGFVQQAKKAGMLWGFYHYANGLHKSSLRAQADYFVDNCANYFNVGVPFLDWEDSDEMYGGAVVKYGPGAAKEFLDRVYERTGIRPIIYMSASAARGYDWSAVAKDYALWGAGYPAGATYDSPGTSLYDWGAWESPAIHQYSSAGGLDKDIAYFDEAGWKKFAGGKDGMDITEAYGSCTGDGTNGSLIDRIAYIDQRVRELHEELFDAHDSCTGDGTNGNVSQRIDYIDMRVREMDVTIAALSEAIKTLSAAQGADPDTIAKAVSDAVKAKLETIKLTVEDGAGSADTGEA